ncbi:hypothetical protein QKU48_gp0244 [Fadolivirus algeromassiliense]|jgi:hypothetical protein|uniref:Transmembrane protein n=1 Tax=Fadolivirus FV1/VV64 TaxID=3070911 RepID=A0A7D3R0H6_9VIRU|nr:hypothetical protein QKU48_gp0244 [Fadolivirus algeromassiliense]QKF93702.1 hypothetical protein Fadolivirus_1_244 [Fadolivirus FV1/VV64]
MFFNIIYKSPIWKSIDTKSRNMRILVMGSIFYVIVHSFIYSKYVESIEFVENYRKYLYYLMVIDLASTGLLMFLSDDKKQKKSKNMKKNNQKKQHKMNLPFQLSPQYQPSLQPLSKINNNPIQALHKPVNKQFTVNNVQKVEDNESIQLPIYKKQNQQPIKVDNDDYEIPVYNHHEEINESQISEQIPIYHNNGIPNIYV